MFVHLYPSIYLLNPYTCNFRPFRTLERRIYPSALYKTDRKLLGLLSSRETLYFNGKALWHTLLPIQMSCHVPTTSYFIELTLHFTIPKYSWCNDPNKAVRDRDVVVVVVCNHDQSTQFYVQTMSIGNIWAKYIYDVVELRIANKPRAFLRILWFNRVLDFNIQRRWYANWTRPTRRTQHRNTLPPLDIGRHGIVWVIRAFVSLQLAGGAFAHKPQQTSKALARVSIVWQFVRKRKAHTRTHTTMDGAHTQTNRNREWPSKSNQSTRNLIGPPHTDAHTSPRTHTSHSHSHSHMSDLHMSDAAAGMCAYKTAPCAVRVWRRMNSIVYIHVAQHTVCTHVRDERNLITVAREFRALRVRRKF